MLSLLALGQTQRGYVSYHRLDDESDLGVTTNLVVNSNGKKPPLGCCAVVVSDAFALPWHVALT